MSTNTDNTRLIALGALVLAVLLVVPPLTMGIGIMGGGMWGGGMGPGAMGPGGTTGWMWMAGLFVQLLFLVAIVGLGYLGVRALTRRESSDDPAIAELRQAYARGDLTDEEFEQRRQRLRDE